MPKRRAGIAARVPPVPSDDHEQVSVWIAGQMPLIQPLITAIDELICSTIPGLSFAIKWANVHYGLPEQGWIIELAAFHKTANVGFFGGADFAHPPPLGETDRSRYVKLSSLEDVHRPELRAWIEEAARTPGWR